MLNDNKRRYGMSSTQRPTLANPTSFSEFWDAILTNQISEIDRANIARYEDAVVNAQRQRTAAITPKVIKLGVCIAQAWRRSRQWRHTPKSAATHILLLSILAKIVFVILRLSIEFFTSHRSTSISGDPHPADLFPGGFQSDACKFRLSLSMYACDFHQIRCENIRRGRK